MDYNFFPSLVSIATIKVTALLWYNEGILDVHTRTAKFTSIKIAEDTIVDKIQKLIAPNVLLRNMVGSVRPVGDEIRRCISRHKIFQLTSKDLCKEIYWTPFGLIDHMKTAENIFNSKLVKFIGSQSVYHQQNFDDRVLYSMYKSLQLPNSKYDPIVQIDTTFCYEGFLDSMIHHDLVGMKFFFQYVNYSQKMDLIRSKFHELPVRGSVGNKGPFVLFFITHMSDFLKAMCFNNHPREVLLSFMEWPLRNFFTSITEKVLISISLEDIKDVIEVIIENIIQFEYETEVYKTMFRDLYMKSPKEMKHGILDKLIYPNFESLFHPYEPEEALAIIFNDDNAKGHIMNLFLLNSDVIIDFLCEENRYKAFLAVVQKCMSLNESQSHFESNYAKFTKAYRLRYYSV